MTINLGHTNAHSSAVRDTLTHVAAVGRLVVNCSVTPLPGPGTNPPVAHIRVHVPGLPMSAYGITTDNAADLEEAGRALLKAAQLLCEDQAAAEQREV